MSDLNLDASAGIDPSTPFCADTYYAGIRSEGCAPFVFNGGLYQSVGGGSEVQGDLGKWAARHDPDGTLRIEYARAAWAKRTSDDEIILLGT